MAFWACMCWTSHTKAGAATAATEATSQPKSHGSKNPLSGDINVPPSRPSQSPAVDAGATLSSEGSGGPSTPPAPATEPDGPSSRPPSASFGVDFTADIICAITSRGGSAAGRSASGAHDGGEAGGDSDSDSAKEGSSGAVRGPDLVPPIDQRAAPGRELRADSNANRHARGLSARQSPSATHPAAAAAVLNVVGAELQRHRKQRPIPRVGSKLGLGATTAGRSRVAPSSHVGPCLPPRLGLGPSSSQSQARSLKIDNSCGRGDSAATAGGASLTASRNDEGARAPDFRRCTAPDLVLGVAHETLPARSMAAELASAVAYGRADCTTDFSRLALTHGSGRRRRRLPKDVPGRRLPGVRRASDSSPQLGWLNHAGCTALGPELSTTSSRSALHCAATAAEAAPGAGWFSGPSGGVGRGQNRERIVPPPTVAPLVQCWTLPSDEDRVCSGAAAVAIAAPDVDVDDASTRTPPPSIIPRAAAAGPATVAAPVAQPNAKRRQTPQEAAQPHPRLLNGSFPFSRGSSPERSVADGGGGLSPTSSRATLADAATATRAAAGAAGNAGGSAGGGGASAAAGSSSGGSDTENKNSVGNGGYGRSSGGAEYSRPSVVGMAPPKSQLRSYRSSDLIRNGGPPNVLSRSMDDHTSSCMLQDLHQQRRPQVGGMGAPRRCGGGTKARSGADSVIRSADDVSLAAAAAAVRAAAAAAAAAGATTSAATESGGDDGGGRLSSPRSCGLRLEAPQPRALGPWLHQRCAQ